MKILKYLSVYFLLLHLTVSGQNETLETSNFNSPLRNLTIEPAIGINPMPSTDLVLSNLIQWNINKRLSIISHTSYAYNNALQRNINFIQTNYNFTLSQKFGVGVSLYRKRSSNTFSFMAGIKYDAYKETLENPDFETVSASESSVSPDIGLMYNWKLGKKKYFFSYRMYIPLYPYPFKTSDINALDGNTASLSMEFGFGIRLK